MNSTQPLVHSINTSSVPVDQIINASAFLPPQVVGSFPLLSVTSTDQWKDHQFEHAQLDFGKCELTENYELTEFMEGPNQQPITYLLTLGEQASRTVGEIMVLGNNITFAPKVLQSFYKYLQLQQADVIYIDMAEWMTSVSPGELVYAYERDIIIVKDVHLVAGDPEWEAATFDLWNCAQMLDALLIFGTQEELSTLKFCLPDLESRLQRFVTLRFSEYSRQQVKSLLEKRLATQGTAIQSAVTTYITNLVFTDPSIDIDKTAEALTKFIKSNNIRNLTIPMLQVNYNKCIVHFNQDPNEILHINTLRPFARSKLVQIDQ